MTASVTTASVTTASALRYAGAPRAASYTNRSDTAVANLRQIVQSGTGTIGPQGTFAVWTRAAMQLHRTGQWRIKQHFHPCNDWGAD